VIKSGAVATIDLNVIAENYRSLQIRCATAQVAATIKADGYGLGAIPIANTLHDAGCRNFYVAHLDEALALRAVIPNCTIYVLHGIPVGAEIDANQKNIIGILTHLGAVERMRDSAKLLNQKIPVVLHVDTGMNRIGFCETQWRALYTNPDLLKGLDVHMVMSHFACSDEPDHPMNEIQRQIFVKATEHFTNTKKSLANSHGIYLGQQMHFDQVRPGRALTGTTGLTGLKNALSVHAPIIQLRSIDSAGSVGYGATQQVQKGTRLAALAYGYADGAPRSLSNSDTNKRHHFFLHGIAVPLVGRISMDLMMVDVSDVPEHLVHEGAMVEIVGSHQSIDDLAAQIGTLGYELMTHMGHRVERRYS
jgi:alanine racemase